MFVLLRLFVSPSAHSFSSRSFDLQNTGQIPEKRFIKIMKTKENVSDEDINEMLEEYKKLYGKKCDVDGMDPGIVYKGKLISTFILI